MNSIIDTTKRTLCLQTKRSWLYTNLALLIQRLRASSHFRIASFTFFFRRLCQC
jgi:hypothetical protein